jgi:hypothetical protein
MIGVGHRNRHLCNGMDLRSPFDLSAGADARQLPSSGCPDSLRSGGECAGGPRARRMSPEGQRPCQDLSAVRSPNQATTGLAGSGGSAGKAAAAYGFSGLTQNPLPGEAGPEPPNL